MELMSWEEMLQFRSGQADSALRAPGTEWDLSQAQSAGGQAL